MGAFNKNHLNQFAGDLKIPDNPEMINPPRKKLLQRYFIYMMFILLLTLFSYSYLWVFTVIIYVFVLVKLYGLSKLWAAYKYSRFLYWTFTFLLIVLFFIISTNVTQKIYESLFQNW